MFLITFHTKFYKPLYFHVGNLNVYLRIMYKVQDVLAKTMIEPRSQNKMLPNTVSGMKSKCIGEQTLLNGKKWGR